MHVFSYIFYFFSLFYELKFNVFVGMMLTQNKKNKQTIE